MSTPEGLTGETTKPWDTAAGAIIAREAGAKVVDIDGSDHTSDSKATIAATPDLLDEVLTLVRDATEPATV
ncbi:MULTISPECIES: inositol monophosphatase family protein [unclassified Frankia]|uniref:inositol monophosphatase family protein n=1 Tax=unclassified Frankia TaxID=2632575 RepID=UPI002AD4F426|nr:MULTISPECIES: inositol monophosphatase family protein [unclassified Frankia]